MQRHARSWLLAGLLTGTLVGSLGAAPTAALAGIDDQLTGYGDFRFGMTIAEAADAAGEGLPTRGADGTAAIETAVVVVGAPARRRLVFVDDRLASIVFVWHAEGGKAAARCGELFARLADQIERRYAKPVLGSDRSSEDGSADTAFWSFPDGASIALLAVAGDGGTAAPPCRATLNYKAPPPDAVD